MAAMLHARNNKNVLHCIVPGMQHGRHAKPLLAN